MPRALAELSHQLPDVALIPYPVVSDRLRIEPWWSNGATTRLVLSEYLKYLAAKVRMRFDSFAERAHCCRAHIATPRSLIPRPLRKLLAGRRSRVLSIYVRSILFNALFYLNLTRAHDRGAADAGAALPDLARLSSVPTRSPACGCCASSAAPRSSGAASRISRKTACIVACKHQSAWETFALYALLDDPVYILKRELMWIPLFGWYTWKAGLIPVDRSAGMAALARMTARAQQALAAGRQLVIFPEGTRRLPGAEPSYKPGVVYLYGTAGVPCVPIALNSGLYWPRRSLLRLPGTIVVEILDPIPPGLDRQAFPPGCKTRIEHATTALVAEAGHQNRK